MTIIVPGVLAADAGLQEGCQDYRLELSFEQPRSLLAVLQHLACDNPFFGELIHRPPGSPYQLVRIIADRHYIYDRQDMDLMLDNDSHILILPAFAEG